MVEFESSESQVENLGGAFGGWGELVTNGNLVAFLEKRGRRIERPLDMAELGFDSRFHTPELNLAEAKNLEVRVGASLLQEAAHASGWDIGEVDAVLLGLTAPVVPEYTALAAESAGVRPEASKLSVHVACDSSMRALHYALTDDGLQGKKVLVGGVEALSRYLQATRDEMALQIFGNGGGVIGLVPGESMKLVVGRSADVGDLQGVLKARMNYPQSRRQGLVEISQVGDNHLRLAGLLHEPDDPNEVADMGKGIAMVKFFVRNGVEIIMSVYEEDRQLMIERGQEGKRPVGGSVHHANFKINSLLVKNLEKAGISQNDLPMPWVLRDFGNVSAASNMIAFLRQVGQLKPEDHVFFHGFGAGGYFDTMI